MFTPVDLADCTEEESPCRSPGQASICASIRMLLLKVGVVPGLRCRGCYVRWERAAHTRAGSARLARQKPKHDAQFGALDQLEPQPGLCDALLGFA